MDFWNNSKMAQRKSRLLKDKLIKKEFERIKTEQKNIENGIYWN
jgi:hypothetical protein